MFLVAGRTTGHGDILPPPHVPVHVRCCLHTLAAFVQVQVLATKHLCFLLLLTTFTSYVQVQIHTTKHARFCSGHQISCSADSLCFCCFLMCRFCLATKRLCFMFLPPDRAAGDGDLPPPPPILLTKGANSLPVFAAVRSPILRSGSGFGH